MKYNVDLNLAEQYRQAALHAQEHGFPMPDPSSLEIDELNAALRFQDPQVPDEARKLLVGELRKRGFKVIIVPE